MPKRNVQQRREGRHALLSSLGGVNQYKLNAHKSGWEQAAKTQARYVEFEKVKSLPEIKYRNRFRSSKERGMLVEKFTKLKIERYGQHMYSPIKSIKKDYEYDRVLRFTPDDLQLRANKKKHSIDTNRPQQLTNERNQKQKKNEVNVEEERKKLKQYFLQKSEWQMRMVEKEKERQKKVRQQEILSKFKTETRNPKGFCHSLWEATLREDKAQDKPQRHEGNQAQGNREQVYLTFPGTNRKVKKSFVQSYRVQKIWALQEQRRKEMVKRAMEAKASEFALLKATENQEQESEKNEVQRRPKEDDENDKSLNVHPEEATSSTLIHRKRRSTINKGKKRRQRRMSLVDRMDIVLLKIRLSALRRGFERWRNIAFLMHLYQLLCKIVNRQLYRALSIWKVANEKKKKQEAQSSLRMYSLLQMKQNESSKKKKMRKALVRIFGRLRTVLIASAFQKWIQFHVSTDPTNSLLRGFISGSAKKNRDQKIKYKSSGFDKEGLQKILQMRNNMPTYANYEHNVSLRGKHTLKPYENKLSDDYFDKHALTFDRRFRVEKVSKVLPKIVWRG